MNGKLFALLAIALLAGTAGYVTHQVSGGAPPAAAPLTAAVSAPVPASADATGTATAATGDPREASFRNLDGGTTTLSAFSGKLLVVNFWATWCPPCLKEIPTFIELQARHGADGLQFVGIALDQEDAVKPFVAEHAINYPVLVGDDDVARYMLRLGNDIGALPYTAVIGRDGAVKFAHRGEWSAAEATRTMAELLEKP